MTKSETIRSLIAKLKSLDKAYYNGAARVSDAKYDTIRARAQRLAPDHAYFKQVGASISSRVKKVRLPITVGSLDKCRPADVKAWASKIESVEKQKRWFATPKLDGASLVIEYVDGKFKAAKTRGDGAYGRDVSQAAMYVQGVRPSLKGSSVYKTKGKIVVRGEVVMHRSIFAENYANKTDLGRVYKTPRNLVNGILNRLDVDKSRDDLKLCTFVALSVFFFDARRQEYYRPDSAHKEWLFLTMMGFTTATNPARYTEGHNKLIKLIKRGHKPLKRYLPVLPVDGDLGQLCWFDSVPTSKELVERLNTMAKAIDVPIDGIVLQPMNNRKFQLKNQHLDERPPFMRAIKLDPSDQTAGISRVGSVTWDISKRGLLKPVIHPEKALNFDGVEVTNITGNNAAFIVKWGLRKGRPIRVVRSGDVIPRIVSVRDNGKWVALQVRRLKGGSERLSDGAGIRDPKMAKSLPTTCPACSTRLRWSSNKTDLLCPNPKCVGRHGKSVIAFFRTLKVDDVAAGVISHLADNGLTTVQKILRGATVQRLRRLEGYGDKKAALVANAIAGALKGKPLARVMHASGVFSNETFALGETRLADIVAHIGAGVVQRENPLKIRRKLADLKGIGQAGIDLFVSKLGEWRKFYASVADYHEESSGPTTLSGLSVAFTGWRSVELEKIIEANGGRVTGVTKRTSVLFARSLGSTKCAKADSYGIPVVSASKAEAWIKQRIVKN